MTRLSVLPRAVRFILCALLLVATCAMAGEAPHARLTVAVPELPRERDPHRAASIIDLSIAAELYTGLLARGADGALVPGAAQSWEVTELGLVYTFRLRPGLVWSDGTPMHAEDFAAGLKRAIDPATAAPFSGQLLVIRGAAAIHRGVSPDEPLGIEVVDAQTLRLTLARPSVRFLDILSRPVSFPVARHLTSESGRAFNGAFVPGTGEGFSLVKNGAYFDAARVPTAEVQFLVAATAQDAAQAVRDGRAQLTLGYGFEAAGRSPPRPAKAERGQALYAVAANARHPLLARREMRHALAMLIDRERLLKILRLRNTTPAYTVAPSNLLPQVPVGSAYRALPPNYRLSIAQVLLDEAKIERGRTPLRLMFQAGPVNETTAREIAARWLEAGFVVELVQKTPAEFTAALAAGDYDTAVMMWPGRDADAVGFFEILSSDAGPANFSGYNEPVFEERLAAADIASVARRREALAEAQTVLLEDQIVLPVFFFVPATSVGRAAGWKPNPYGIHPLRFMSPGK